MSAYSLRLLASTSGGSLASTQPIVPYEVTAVAESRTDGGRIVVKDMGVVFSKAWVYEHQWRGWASQKQFPCERSPAKA
jgi:hypothetical protein